jgi:hypothetical protein
MQKEARIFAGVACKSLHLLHCIFAAILSPCERDCSCSAGGVCGGRSCANFFHDSDESLIIHERIFQSPAQVQVEFYDYTLHVIGEVFYAAGRERGTFAESGTRLNLAIRISRIFRRVGDRWRQIHHHGSIDDPQLLSAYQQAVS